MVVPLSGLHGGTTENMGAEEERSQFITAYRKGGGFSRARTRLLNGYRRSADRVTDFRDRIGLTTQPISYF